ncbi:MAG TPA: tetratricopeptide repeat protein [Gemmatimonadales bacterium]|nr:tetratricopeptide repeat protein [Gemmatimonadales bacterium]
MAISSEIEKLERRWNENPSGLMFAPLAEAYRKTGDLQRALEILEVGLSVHPDYIPALIVRGRCHLDAADLAAAELALEQVLARDPANPIALRAMADLCERGGRIGEAIERLELLVDLDRSHADARANLDRLRTVSSALTAAGESSPSAPELPVSRPVASEAVAAASPPDSVPTPARDELASGVATPDFVIENLNGDPVGGPEESGMAPDVRMPWEPVPLPGPEEPVPAEESPSATSDGAGSAPIAEAAGPPAAAMVDADAVALAAPAALPAGEPGPIIDLLSPAPAEPVSLPALELPRAPEETAPEDWVPLEPAADVPSEVAGLIPEGTVSEAPSPAAVPEPPLGGLADGKEPMGEVAQETPAGESPVMSETVPPESPEGAEIPWPAVSAAEGGEESDSPPAAEPELPAGASSAPVLIVTESMAELFLRQGHRELALAVYRQLLERSPDDAVLREAIAGLEQDGEARGGAAREETDRPSRAASETGGTPVEAMLRAVLASPPPAGAPTVLPPAIEPALTGEPTRPGMEPITLGQVFGDEPSVPPPAMESDSAGGQEPSFDEFFGAPADVPAGTGARPPEGDDMRQFTEWLKGLKR